MSILGVSAALNISKIPFEGPMAGVRVGRIQGQWVINPTFQQLEYSDVEIVVAGTADAILMVEGGAIEVPEEEIAEALTAAHEAIKELCRIQEEFLEGIRQEKMEWEKVEIDEKLTARVDELVGGRIGEAMAVGDKAARNELLSTLRAEIQLTMAEDFPDAADIIKNVISSREKAAMRKQIIDKKIRADGRGPDDIRPINSEVGVLPRVHGSALFTRGQTQALGVVTLGTQQDEQRIESVNSPTEVTKSFMLHYNFPPFSTGEAKPLRGTSRREQGHGALAERAIQPLLPAYDEFPYTIRVVSEVLESNGSSSMASVCAASLALMDAGVPMRAACAGVAMGLIKEGDEVEVLTDILGLEDALGDMDFKVAGSEKGVTSIQMDIKITGLTLEIMRDALQRAKKGRMHILGEMKKALETPRAELSTWAPRIITIQINPEKIGEIIGPKGKTIRAIQEETGAQISVDDTGLVTIASVSGEGGERAKARIKGMTQDPDVGADLRGRGEVHDHVRRVHRDPAGHRGAAAHLRDAGRPHGAHGGRGQEGRDRAGQAPVHRREGQDAAVAQGCAGGRRGEFRQRRGRRRRRVTEAGYRRSVLPNGLVVLTESMPGIRSASIGVWVRAGSIHESPAEMGVSHMLEHMVFKGTERRTARDLALVLERVGGSLDAYTTREHTSYQARVLDTDVDLALDVLADLVLSPLLRPADLDMEREVVLEEIATVEDTPDDLVFDLHADLMWQGHPYGYSILGTVDTVSSLTTDHLRKVHAERYAPSDMVVAAAGNIDHEAFVERVAAEFGRATGRLRQQWRRGQRRRPSVTALTAMATPACAPCRHGRAAGDGAVPDVRGPPHGTDTRRVGAAHLRAGRSASHPAGAAVQRVRRRHELAAVPARAGRDGTRVFRVCVPVVLRRCRRERCVRGHAAGVGGPCGSRHCRGTGARRGGGHQSRRAGRREGAGQGAGCTVARVVQRATAPAGGNGALRRAVPQHGRDYRAGGSGDTGRSGCTGSRILRAGPAGSAAAGAGTLNHSRG
jgi:polyribonucleotide nucleotidyltransferase